MKQTLLFILFEVLGMAEALTGTYYYNAPPIVREGVQWVNEKVVINQGDTTHYYYNYEFCGQDTDTIYMNMGHEINQALYYYTGNRLDIEKDSLIAGLRQLGYEVTCFRNNAYENAIDRGRLMFPVDMYMDGGTRILYSFKVDHNIYNGELRQWIRWYWLDCQWFWTDLSGEESIVTEDNLVMVDSINIEGQACARCAYISEEGDTLAYVVEGIGFDSRDMGDLLTPFTRKPDPNADYQEYCGLSHVVKDGKIIYKGMRYRHGAFDAIDEVVADQTRRPANPHYYNLMGQPVGTEVPTAPGIYIHNGKKIIVR